MELSRATLRHMIGQLIGLWREVTQRLPVILACIVQIIGRRHIIAAFIDATTRRIIAVVLKLAVVQSVLLDHLIVTLACLTQLGRVQLLQILLLLEVLVEVRQI